MKHLETVINSGIFSKIEKSEYIYTFEELQLIGRKYEKGSVIYREGEVIRNICIIKSGCVRSEKMYVEGESHILKLWQAGSIFGIEHAVQSGSRSTVDYVCHEDCEIVFVSWDSICGCTKSEKIIEGLLPLMAYENIDRINKVNILAHRNLKDKIMCFLELWDRVDNELHEQKVINMNREEMSQYLSVNRSALSSELNKMKKEGLIGFNKNRFYVLENKMVS